MYEMKLGWSREKVLNFVLRLFLTAFGEEKNEIDSLEFLPNV